MKKLLLIAAVAAIFAISSADLISEALEAHNNERVPLGIPALKWSSSLARSAQSWANNLARTRSTSHSKNRNNVGENLAYGSSRSNSVTRLIQRWIDEKRDFVEGEDYPRCTTGGESDVWHYTQMVWEKTTEVGCGLGTSSGQSYLVCQYSPAGNRRGQPVYTVRSVDPEEPEAPEQPEEPEEPIVTPPVEPTEPVVTPPVEPTEPTEPVVVPPVVSEPEEPANDFVSQSLAAHNKYRNPYGVPSLTWSTSLAQSAQAWADTLARTNQFSHSNNRNGVGENIAWSTSRDAAGFVDMWGEEKKNFIPGRNYPDCSNGGEVGHYTQIMWRKTTEVGCGLAINGKKKYYVCQYSPAGNRRGDPVY